MIYITLSILMMAATISTTTEDDEEGYGAVIMLIGFACMTWGEVAMALGIAGCIIVIATYKIRNMLNN